MEESKIQCLADKFTNEVLTAKFGMRFTSLNDLEDDKELSVLWDILNENFYELINSIN